MKDSLKIIGSVVVSLLIILLILQAFILYEVYTHEKDNFRELVESSLYSSVEKLIFTRDTLDSAMMISCNYQNHHAYIKRNQRDTSIIFPKDANIFKQNCQFMYEAMISETWRLDTLQKIFLEHLPFSPTSVTCHFQLKDENGRVTDQTTCHSRLYCGSVRTEIPLGIIRQHRLEACVSLPLKWLFVRTWDRIFPIFILVVILIIGGIYVYRQYRREKQINDNHIKFSHILAHNLRSPLLNIKRYLEMLRIFLTKDLDETRQKKLRECKEQITEFIRDIEKAQALSVNAHGLIVHPENTDIRIILTKLREEYQQVSDNKTVSILLNNHLTAPFIYADATHLYNSLVNLLENAIRYSGPAVEITITVEKRPRQFILSVKDNGIGIPPEEQEEVFKPGKRGAHLPEEHKNKGSGLGLSYVLAVTEAHHGNIRLLSDGQQGTEFIITLPQPD